MGVRSRNGREGVPRNQQYLENVKSAFFLFINIKLA